MPTTFRLTLSAALLAALLPSPAFATGQVLDDAMILSLAVNGGADTINPGTTCVRVSLPVVAACSSGYVAIQNNNKQLMATAMQAKASSNKVWFYYDDSTGSATYHCPGRVFTPCSVISIELK